MRVLFDHGTPAPLAKALQGHTVRFAKCEGWDTFSNGALLAAAEAAGGRSIAIVVLMNAQWPVWQRHVERVRAVVDEVSAGGFHEVVAD